MTINWITLAQLGIRGLSPYQPGRSQASLSRDTGIQESIKLASNENPRGPSPRAQAFINNSTATLNRYPDNYELSRCLGQHLAVSTDQITLGNGSNDVLDLLARVFLGPGRTAVVSKHCFLVYPIVVGLAGACLKEVPARNYGHDLAAMAAAVDATTSLMFIANPNNPTGTCLTQTEIKACLEQIPKEVVVVLDEAYREYVDTPDYPDSLALLQKYDNLVLTRTFSKAYGLAAARIGYSLSNPAIAELLNRARQPFNVNSLALGAAIVAMEDQQYIEQSVQLNKNGLEQLTAGLKQFKLPFIPSSGNFVSFAVPTGQTGVAVYEALLQQGVIVRPIANYDMPHHLRVTAGLPEENDRFLQALAIVLEEGASRKA